MLRTPSTSAAARPAIPTRSTSSRSGPCKRPATPHAWSATRIPGAGAAYTRLIGYAPSAGFVLTVIIDPQDSFGVTAWKTRGADLRHYLERKDIADD